MKIFIKVKGLIEFELDTKTENINYLSPENKELSLKINVLKLMYESLVSSCCSCNYGFLVQFETEIFIKSDNYSYFTIIGEHYKILEEDLYSKELGLIFHKDTNNFNYPDSWKNEFPQSLEYLYKKYGRKVYLINIKMIFDRNIEFLTKVRYDLFDFDVKYIEGIRDSFLISTLDGGRNILNFIERIIKQNKLPNKYLQKIKDKEKIISLITILRYCKYYHSIIICPDLFGDYLDNELKQIFLNILQNKRFKGCILTNL